MSRRSLPPLNALRAFEAFARHGRMLSAADELCVTHGAVSRQVKLLQEILGRPLVEGPRHQLRLTEAGVKLAAGLTRALDLLDETVAGVRAPLEREIEISCMGTFAMKWLIPRLPRFLERNPGVKIRISESHAPVDFRREGFAGAIRLYELQAPDPIEEATAFMPQHQGPVASPALLGEDVSLERLLALPRLYSGTYRANWDVWAAGEGLRLPPAAVEREFEHNYYMIEAAAAGLGVAVVPWAFVAPDIEAGRLVAPFGFAPRTARFVFLRPRAVADPAVDAFRDWLVEEGAASPQPPA